MKYIFFLFVLSFEILSLKSQVIKSEDICKYKIAYNYILNDSVLSKDSISFNGLQFSTSNTIISDSIVFIYKYPFYKEYKNKKETDKEAFMRVSKLDHLEYYSPIYSPQISDLFHYKEEVAPLFVLYFSSIENDILLCEIMPLHNSLNLSISENACFNQSFQYMFVFNRNNLINRVIKKEMAYD